MGGFQYTYHIEYRCTKTGAQGVWNSRQHNKKASILDFQNSFGSNFEVLRAYIPSSGEIKEGISKMEANTILPPSLRYRAHYCPVCLDTMAHKFKDYEHPFNDVLGEEFDPVVARIECNRCGNIREEWQTHD